ARAAAAPPCDRPRPPRLRAPGAPAARRDLRLRAAGRQLPRPALAADRVEDRGGERTCRCRDLRARARGRPLERSGARLSRASEQGRYDRRAEATRHTCDRLAGDATGLGRVARRACCERAQPARHAPRPCAEGVPRGRTRGRGAGRDRRPAASLRSSRDGDARGCRVERAWRAARLEVRGAIHGTRPMGCDRRTRRPHFPRRADVPRRVDRADARRVLARPVGARMSSAERPTKYGFVTGGGVSALGKGIVAGSLGRLLKARGLRVQAQKFDPYLNVDPGTMSPFQHGEVFVTEDGAETDLDIGHYERFIDENLTRAASHTAGAIWDSVLRKERKGEFLGATVQVIPHITNEIKHRIRASAVSTPTDVVISEIGGTVGD